MESEASNNKRLFRPVLIAGLLTSAFVIGLVVIGPGDEQLDRFCTADGRIDHPTARRDPTQGCNWIDEDGNLLP